MILLHKYPTGTPMLVNTEQILYCDPYQDFINVMFNNGNPLRVIETLEDIEKLIQLVYNQLYHGR